MLQSTVSTLQARKKKRKGKRKKKKRRKKKEKKKREKIFRSNSSKSIQCGKKQLESHDCDQVAAVVRLLLWWWATWRTSLAFLVYATLSARRVQLCDIRPEATIALYNHILANAVHHLKHR